MKSGKKVIRVALAILCMVSMLFISEYQKVEVYAASGYGFIFLSAYEKTLKTGDTYCLSVVSSGSKKPTFTSSDSKVASVNTYGKITAKKAGSATITAKTKNAEASCKVTVTKTKVTLNKTSLILENGESAVLTAASSTGHKVTWKSAKTSIASVSENGKVTAVGTSGTATITVKVEGTDYSDTCTVSIVQKVTAINAENLTVGKNGTGKIKVTTTPSGLVEDLTYTSGATNIATVAQDGTVTGVAEGTATITIKGKVSTNVSTTCTVTVTKPTVSVTAADIAANKGKYYGKVAENYTQGGLTYKIFYVDKENKFGDGANTVYLKADYKDSKSLTTDISSLTTDDIQKYKNMNPVWNAARGTVAQSSWNNNEKASAWLCAPSQWTTYVDSTKANYATGGPSVEMYVASYNDVKHDTGTAKGGLSAEYSTEYAHGYIYKVNGTLNNSGWSTNDDALDYKGYNSMYAGRNGSKTGYWWLASPSSGNSDCVCFVNGSNADLGSNYSSGTYGVGPLVSLKSGIPVQVEE